MYGEGAGWDRRREAEEEGGGSEGKRSFSVAVLALEGRGGGEAMMPLVLAEEVVVWDKGPFVLVLAAKGSSSATLGGADGRLSLRALGGGFWRELRVLEGVREGEFSEVGVFVRNDGGGGACLAGAKGVCFAASAAWRFDSARRALYSWMDSREGLWYSTVTFD